jgi:hypothetical protein
MNDIYIIQTRLIDLRKLQKIYFNENITQLLISIILKYEIVNKFNYFILNNASLNDICVNEILAAVRLKILPRERLKRRLRY